MAGDEVFKVRIHNAHVRVVEAENSITLTIKLYKNKKTIKMQRDVGIADQQKAYVETR